MEIMCLGKKKTASQTVEADISLLSCGDVA